MKKIFKSDFFFLGIILLLSLVQLRFLFTPGLYTFSDEPHIANLYEMIRAITGGQFPPRWAPDMSFNYGYPLFNFYYPLPFYIGSFFSLIFKASLIDSLKIVFGLSVIFSGFTFYALAKNFFSQLTAFACTIVYLFTPYRAVDLYVRGAVGEMWSFVFIPLTLLAFYNLIEKRNIKNFIFASISLALLIMAHNLTAIIFLPILAIYCLVLIIEEKEKRRVIGGLAGSVLLGLSFSAFYWLPAVLEKGFIQSGTPFNPFDHFPFIKQLVIPSWGYGASVWGPYDGMSFQIGLINLVAVIIIVLSLVFKRKELKENKHLLFFFLGLFALSIFLMNIRSWFLWKILPLGDYIQFPWRLLMLTTLATAFLIGFSENIKGRIGKFLPLVLALGSVVLTWNYFQPAKIQNVNDDYYLNRFFPGSKEYLNYSEDYLPLTIWTKQRPRALPDKKIETDKGTLEFEELTPTIFTGRISSEKPAKIFFHNYYFPGWKILVDNKEIAIEKGPVVGDMEVSVPSGDHKMIFKFEETIIRKIADSISFVSMFLIFTLLLTGFNPVKRFYHNKRVK